jgi:hypothetical protein
MRECGISSHRFLNGGTLPHAKFVHQVRPSFGAPAHFADVGTLAMESTMQAVQIAEGRTYPLDHCAYFLSDHLLQVIQDAFLLWNAADCCAKAKIKTSR